MKTLVMHKFTILMEQFSTGARTKINKADDRTPTGFKNTKHTITVLGCANASDIHQINPAVTKESQHLRCFKGVHNLPVHYDTNKEAWVTREIFSVWFHNNFVPAA